MERGGVSLTTSFDPCPGHSHSLTPRTSGSYRVAMGHMRASKGGPVDSLRIPSPPPPAGDAAEGRRHEPEPRVRGPVPRDRRASPGHVRPRRRPSGPPPTSPSVLAATEDTPQACMARCPNSRWGGAGLPPRISWKGWKGCPRPPSHTPSFPNKPASPPSGTTHTRDPPPPFSTRLDRIRHCTAQKRKLRPNKVKQSWGA